MKQHTSKASRARRAALMGLLAALALTLSFLENLLPAIPGLPPGAKPGFANIVTMFAAYAVDLPAAFLITFVKAAFAGITRGPAALVMSFCGGMLSTAVLGLLVRLKKNPFGMLGVSVLCAVAHNAGQLLAASFLTGTASLLFYAPALLLFGVGTGLVTGVVLRAVLPVLLRQSRFFTGK